MPDGLLCRGPGGAERPHLLFWDCSRPRTAVSRGTVLAVRKFPLTPYSHECKLMHSRDTRPGWYQSPVSPAMSRSSIRDRPRAAPSATSLMAAGRSRPERTRRQGRARPPKGGRLVLALLASEAKPRKRLAGSLTKAVAGHRLRPSILSSPLRRAFCCQGR